MSDKTTPPEDDLDLGDENAKVFLSYSRKDRERAQRIADVLRDRHFGVFRDTDDILPTEEWRVRLEQLIAEADTIVFLLSPHSAASEVCAWEVDLARDLNKRIAPIVIDDVPAETIPEPLTHLNFIFCTERDRFEDAVDSLVSALGVDIDWIREHTRIATLARRWHEQGRPSRLLLRGQDIADAERWRDDRPREAPVLTERQSAFIAESRRQALRRQRWWIGGSFGVAAATLALAAVAAWQSIEADRQRDVAQTNADLAQENARLAEANAARADARAEEAQRNLDQALSTQSRFLADLGVQRTSGQGTDLVAAMALALEALPDATPGPDGKPLSSRPAVPQAERLLFETVTRNRELHVLDGHSPGIGSFDVSADGTRLLSVGGDFEPRIWDLTTGRLAHELEAHAWLLHEASFSPDGKLALTAVDDGSNYDRNVRLFDVGTGQLLHSFEAHDQPLLGAVFVENGEKIVSSSRANDACIWRTADLSKVYCLENIPGAMIPNRAAVSPDGKWVALRMKDEVIVWSMDDPTFLWVLRGHRAIVRQAVYSPDGKSLTSIGGDGSFAIWDPATSLPIVEPQKIQGVDAIESVAYRPDSARVVLGTRKGEIIFVDVADGYIGDRFDFGTGAVYELVYSPDGSRLAIGGQAARAVILPNGGWQPEITLDGVDEAVTALVFTPDGERLITGGGNGRIRIWSLETAATDARSFEGIGHGFGLSPDGRSYLAAPRGDPQWLALLDLTTGETRWRLETKPEQIRLAQFSDDGKRVIVGRWNGVITLHDVADGKQLAEVDVGGENLVIGGVVELGDGRLAVSFHLNGGEAPPIRIVSLDGTGAEETLAAPKNPNRTLAITPDRTRLAAMSYRDVHLWDLTSRERIAVLADHEAYLRDMAISPDGSLLATVADDSKVRLWRTSDGSLVHVMEGHGKAPKGWRGGDVDYIVIESVEFDATGERLITASKDRTARIWDVNTGAALGVLEGHDASLLAARFNADATRAATISWDGHVRIFDTATSGLLREIAITDEENAAVQTGDVRFLPDGRSVLYVSAEGTAIPDTEPDTQALVAKAKASLSRCLPVDERRAAFLDPAPPRWCITGPGLETEPDPANWRPIQPYRGDVWRDWLAARDAGENVPVPEE
ncbi:MAG: toll/interleukin-1 receptor domain-containing protein [Minwuia sp.]|uniref:toll/interleukin-1 receptor domain-containing protein n=1 Tax=Minwuia sp. TaxID=2493630 RepID=UPI003A8C0476